MHSDTLRDWFSRRWPHQVTRSRFLNSFVIKVVSFEMDRLVLICQSSLKWPRGDIHILGEHIDGSSNLGTPPLLQLVVAIRCRSASNLWSPPIHLPAGSVHAHRYPLASRWFCSRSSLPIGIPLDLCAPAASRRSSHFYLLLLSSFKNLEDCHLWRTLTAAVVFYTRGCTQYTGWTKLPGCTHGCNLSCKTDIFVLVLVLR